MELTVASYNIHGCIGCDGLFSAERIADVLVSLNADVIALQEVETVNHAGLDILKYFSERTGMQYISGPTMHREDGHYGNALLLKQSAENVQQHDISVPKREPRGIIDIHFQWQHRIIRVLATHLGLSPYERRHQVKQHLLPLLKQSLYSDYTILMGDLNEWLLWGRPLRWLKEHFTESNVLRTYPGRWPLFALDRIWVYPHHHLKQSETIRSPISKIASDHLPLRAVIVGG